MQYTHFFIRRLPISRRSGPHSVPAIRPSPLGYVARCRFAAILLRIASGTVLALPVHCGSARAEAARVTPVVSSNTYPTFIAEASQRFGVPVSWLRAVIQVESAGNPKAVSPKGAMGLMQLMPDTWSALRVQYHLGNDPFDPRDNILGGAAYLRELFDRFGASGFLAAYNAGPKRFQDYLTGLRPLRDETTRYLSTLAQMLPDLQIGGALPPLRVASDWRAASLFTTSATTVSSPNSSHGDTASENATTTKSFTMSPQSDGLFVPVRMPDQR